MIEIGQEVTFTPHAWMGANPALGALNKKKVTGHVDYINRKHGYYRVKYKNTGLYANSYDHECFSLPEDERRARNAANP